MQIINTFKLIFNHPLNSNIFFSALLNYLKWQIGSRLVPGQVIFKWVNESKLIAFPGETGVTGNVYCGLHEFEDMSYLLHVLSENDVFVDIGANVGSYTILASAVKKARSYSFEPIKKTYNRLMDNVRVNNICDRVYAFNLGISFQKNQISFTVDENAMNHAVAENEHSANVELVDVLPLDTVLENVSPSIMKIDVEGFETHVIEGAHAILSSESLHSIIMELNDSGLRYGFDEAKLLEKVKSYGFSTYSYNPFSRELTDLDGKNNDSGNTLFIRDIEKVRLKIKSSPKVTINNISF